MAFLVILILNCVGLTALFGPAVASTGTVYIRANGSIDPPTSPLQNNGTIYTLTGDVSSDSNGVVVEKDGVVLDGAGFTIQGTGTINSFGVGVEGRINVTVKGTRVEGFQYGINVVDSLNVEIAENVIEENVVGVLFQNCSFNGILKNEIIDNHDGVDLHSSLNCTVCGNFVAENSLSGLGLCSSQNNTIIHNSFVANLQQVNSCPNLLNVWNGAYPSGGNWWSKSYNGTDIFEGRFQNITGSDGIGDATYVIDNISIDSYPLMGPWIDTGQNITATYSPSISFTYSNVVSSGVLILNVTHATKPAPLGFLFLGAIPVFYDVNTTASYSSSISITLPYTGVVPNSLAEKNLVLVQWNETSQNWDNITTGTDRTDNSISGETSQLSIFTVIVPLFGDINKDGTVDIYDAILLAGAFNSTPGSPKWNPAADINKDNVVDIYDAIILASNFGKTGGAG